MSQVRDDMEEMLGDFELKLLVADHAALERTTSSEDVNARAANSTSFLAVGSTSGYEVLLPKYDISTGRAGDAESISQARIYLQESSRWFETENKSLIDGVDPDGKAYVGFLLSSVQENKSEKVQTLPLNGDNFVTTFYGEAPTVYSFGGILYNTHYARWREIFSRLYDKVFRGSAISKHRQLLHIVYDSKIVSGWMLNLSQSLNAQSDTMSNFSFQFLVRSEVTLAADIDLAYNNAYFTGKAVSKEHLDALSDLPESDDYLNVARMKAPPQRQKGIGGKGKSYLCRPGAVTTTRNSRKGKTNPKFKGQYIRTGSPAASGCDVAQAAMNVINKRNADIKILNDKYKKIPEPTKEQTTAHDTKVSKITAKTRRMLNVTWKNLENTSDIEDPVAKKRAEILKQEVGSKKGLLTGTLEPIRWNLIAEKIHKVPAPTYANASGAK